MRRTNIYLSEEQCQALDHLAAQEAVSRAELIRRVLDRWLDGDSRDVEADLDAIDASFGVLGDVELAGRGVDARARYLDEMWRLGR